MISIQKIKKCHNNSYQTLQTRKHYKNPNLQNQNQNSQLLNKIK